MYVAEVIATGEAFSMKVFLKDQVVKENMMDNCKNEISAWKANDHPCLASADYIFEDLMKIYVVLPFMA